MKKVEVLNFKNKLGIDFDPDNITQFRKNCKNVKLRNIYFRLIHKDFFTYSRMLKYKMTQTDKCPRCGSTETINHLLMECHHAGLVWEEYNKLMRKIGEHSEIVSDYQGIYVAGRTPVTALIKIRVIQELIQINRPKLWCRARMENIVEELLKMESYIAQKNNNMNKFLKKWNFIIHQQNLGANAPA
jgi:ribosomal protein L32